MDRYKNVQVILTDCASCSSCLLVPHSILKELLGFDVHMWETGSEKNSSEVSFSNKTIFSHNNLTHI